MRHETRDTRHETRDTRQRVASIILGLVTPLLEKNPAKTRAFDLPLVFSMARLIVLAFAIGLLHQIWYAGVAGWPEATLAIAIVLALPVLNAMERVRPETTLDVGKAALERFGVGSGRTIASVLAREPSKFDDHRSDAR